MAKKTTMNRTLMVNTKGLAKSGKTTPKELSTLMKTDASAFYKGPKSAAEPIEKVLLANKLRNEQERLF